MKSAAFDPHAETLTGRDRWFLVYLLALAVIPLIAAVVILVVLYQYDPTFDTLPKGPAPMEIQNEYPRKHAQEIRISGG